MRWKLKKVKAPKDGEERIRAVFAWRPTDVENYVVFLEHYQIHERYFEPANGNPGWWAEFARYVCVYY